jgi:hypothetical protein
VPLTELPFGFPGRIFRSPMPFGRYDLHGEVYDHFCEEQIAVIVLLASDEECLHKTGCHLRALYLKAGFQVLYLPIPDFGVPTKDDLEQTVQQTIAYAQARHHTTPGGMLGGPATTHSGTAHAHLSPVEPLRGTCTSQKGCARVRDRGSALQLTCA